jgi:hypothetical protein
MNSDIVYEILKWLHLSPEENGGALLAKKVTISARDHQKLAARKMEKPTVFILYGDIVFSSDPGLIIYYSRGIILDTNNNSWKNSFVGKKK